MDILTCATLSALEGYSLAHFGPLHLSARLFLYLFIAHYFVFKFYRIYVYPRYVSPMRHLPGPKVNIFEDLDFGHC